MTRMDSMLSKTFQSRRKIARPPAVQYHPARRLGFAIGAVPAAAAAGLLIGELIKLMR
ncbi:hypothetical protein [Alsobacter soli]|uniref:hypothetical protein n=1 Tax=Alsobacter soli TaxID=2109933 RepID=UPI001304B6D9|nr:hypothetical protein [Alsobacter soli]